ncbi:Urease accessory protein UreE-like protein [Thermocrinis albus DSM 14484]|uniref:Urease accessory protein UreE-like protein n=1 Tax=Thermocrinis albus (strain DSM 14484 / JCM 11386 / HI 11/12) TaxID=638303 RepID=D3SQB9_THEAH|nr:urease accessory protein UreE [Thermocrinis albus]ADC89356.1 Urease accessory protein UreE-like protein [Thermocrinis albus DSM 14484]
MRRVFVYEIPNVTNEQLSAYNIKEIKLSYYERQKVRQKIKIEEELEIIIILKDRTHIRPFSYIYIDSSSKTAYKVVPLEEECLVIEVDAPLSYLLLGHILGNMHLPIGIWENKVTTIFDPTVEYRLNKYGFKTNRLIVPFVELSEHTEHMHSHG